MRLHAMAPVWGLVWLASGAALGETAPLHVGLSAQPERLFLGRDTGARVIVDLRDPLGAPVGGAPPEVLARLGRLGPLREAGPGRYEADYQPPATRFPQLEILVARLPGRALAWITLPLWGAGVVRVEADPGAEVTLEVSGRAFGPVRADTRGLAPVPFESPPGTEQGELVLADGARRAIELGVPALAPLWLLAESDRLRLPAERATRLHLFAVDAAGRPWAEAPVVLSAEGAEIDPPRETSPGHFEAELRVASGAASGEILARAGLAPPVAGPAALVRLVVEAPPALAPPEPAPASAPPAPAPPPWWQTARTYAWASLGLGLAAVVPGGVLVGMDGKETCDAPDGARRPRVYDTLVPGAVLLGAGAALLGTALLLALLGDDGGAGAVQVELAPGAAGLTLSGGFRF